MFSRFREAHEAKNDTEMIEIAGKIFDELDVHTTIEEEIFYPSVQDTSEEIHETVDEGVQEHHVVKVLMQELGEVEPASDEWVAKLMVLIENVEHHAEEEEKEMFPPLRSSLSSEQLEALATRLEERKASLGAPILQDKIDLTKEALLSLAKDQQIPGRSTMDQEELAATVAPG
jgi:hemerythrin-like domain-containing protein